MDTVDRKSESQARGIWYDVFPLNWKNELKSHPTSDDFLLRTEKVQALKTPTKRNQNSVYNFIDQTQSVVLSEKDWICQRDDLAALSHNAEQRWINGFVENQFLRFCPNLLTVSPYFRPFFLFPYFQHESTCKFILSRRFLNHMSIQPIPSAPTKS